MAKLTKEQRLNRKELKDWKENELKLLKTGYKLNIIRATDSYKAKRKNIPEYPDQDVMDEYTPAEYHKWRKAKLRKEKSDHELFLLNLKHGYDMARGDVIQTTPSPRTKTKTNPIMAKKKKPKSKKKAVKKTKKKAIPQREVLMPKGFVDKSFDHLPKVAEMLRKRRKAMKGKK